MFFSLIYSSVAVSPITDEGLTRLLLGARAHNRMHDLSGLLLYHREKFMQLIEGPEAAVLDLFTKICRDPRHRNIVLLDERRMRQRYFPDWKMGFQRLADNAADLPQGFDPFLSLRRDSQHLPVQHPATKYLLKFKGVPPML